MDRYTPSIGDLVVGFDGHTTHSGRVVVLHTMGGHVVDTLGCGRTVLSDVRPAPVGHPVHARA